MLLWSPAVAPSSSRPLNKNGGQETDKREEEEEMCLWSGSHRRDRGGGAQQDSRKSKKCNTCNIGMYFIVSWLLVTILLFFGY